MDIAMIQTDLVWERPSQNRDRLLGMICGAPRADMIILPEMFATGFTMAPGKNAEKNGGATLEWMMAVAAERSAAVAGTIAVKDGGGYRNRFYFVRPDGAYDTYDKRHLFSPSGEHEHYAAGTERVVVGYKGFRILLQTCYDLRFPVFSRNRGDYDMIIYSANWAASRAEAWDILLRARAVENVCYVAGVNRIGSDHSASYDGHSALIDYKGRIVAHGETGVEQAVSGRADLESLERFRLKFPVMHDADDFSLII